MMKWNNNYTKIAFYAAALLLTAYLMPVEKNWTPSYSQKHNWPYGTKVLYELLPALFPESELSIMELPFYNQEIGSNNQLYWVVDQSFRLDSLELSKLLQLVRAGNDAFISTMDFSYRLMDSLAVVTGQDYKRLRIPGTEVRDTMLHCFEPDYNQCYSQKRLDSEDYFQRDSLSKSIAVITVDEQNRDHALYIKVPFGKGHFYLHNQPLLLTNYAILRPEGKAYIERLTSYLPNKDIVWDENHKAINSANKDTPMRVVLSQPAFRWAYWLTVLGLLLLFFVRAKREQRAIPVVEPPANASKQFAETMGALYFNQSNNRNLALKKIAILKEYIARKLYLQDVRFVEDEIKYLSNKSGHDEAFIAKMLKLVNSIQNTTVVSDGQLTVLNRTINRFIKQRI